MFRGQTSRVCHVCGNAGTTPARLGPRPDSGPKRGYKRHRSAELKGQGWTGKRLDVDSGTSALETSRADKAGGVMRGEGETPSG